MIILNWVFLDADMWLVKEWEKLKVKKKKKEKIAS